MKKKYILVGIVIILLIFYDQDKGGDKIPQGQREKEWNCLQNSKENPMIHQEETKIVDVDGNPIKFRGVNLGGWLLWEGWIWGGGFNSETTVLNRLRELVGHEETENFQYQVYNYFITEKDIAFIAELGFNVIRVPINHRLLEDDDKPYVYKQPGWQILDKLINWAEKYNVYVVLGLHSAPGGQAKLFTADPKKDLILWDSESNKKRTIALWKEIANRYKDRKIIAGYDILNEPEPHKEEELVVLYKHIIEAIREVDTYHMIIIEGTDFSRDFSMFKEPLSDNQAYGFHMYTWLGDDRQKKLNAYKELSEQQCIPLWNGEFGENTYEMIESTIELFENPENKVNGWIFWTWKRAPAKYPHLYLINTTENWEKVIKWINWPRWPNNKPSKEEALKGIREFTESIQFENNVINQKMIDVLTFAFRLNSSIEELLYQRRLL